MGRLGIDSWRACDPNWEGDVRWRGRFGLGCVTGCDCFCRLPEEVVDLSVGVLFVPMFANPATLSLANAVKDLLLLLGVRFEEEAECW